MTHGASATAYQRQHGAALAVSLILLLVMTLVGVAAMNGARMEVSMAGLTREGEVALRRSERVLLEAEAVVENIPSPILFPWSTAGDEFYLSSEAPDTSILDWAANFVSAPSAAEDATLGDDDNGIDDDSTYVVEYLGRMPLPDEGIQYNPDGSIAGDNADVYRVTTRTATGGKAVRIIESIYTTEPF